MEVHSSTSSHPSPARFICQAAVASIKMVVRIQSRDAIRRDACSWKGQLENEKLEIFE